MKNMCKKIFTGYGCPECESTNFYYDEEKQETSCLNCGLVILAKYHQYGVVFPGFKPIFVEKI